MIVEFDKYKISNTLFDTHSFDCDYCGLSTRGRCYIVSIKDETSSIRMPIINVITFCKKCGVRANLHTENKELIKRGMSLFKIKGIL